MLTSRLEDVLPRLVKGEQRIPATGIFQRLAGCRTILCSPLTLIKQSIIHQFLVYSSLISLDKQSCMSLLS